MLGQAIAKRVPIDAWIWLRTSLRGFGRRIAFPRISIANTSVDAVSRHRWPIRGCIIYTTRESVSVECLSSRNCRAVQLPVGAIAAESVCQVLSKPVVNRIIRTNTNHGFLFCHIALHATNNTAARTCDHAKRGPPGLFEDKETNGRGERSQLLPHGSPPYRPPRPTPHLSIY